MKNEFMNSILVLRKAVFLSSFSTAVLAPLHMRDPLMSTPMKFLSGKIPASPVVYSPFPQASSRTTALKLEKTDSLHFPLML